MPGLVQKVVSGCAAAAVALALSGVPGLVEPAPPTSGHRCHCPVGAGQHDCECPCCQAGSARQARPDGGVPGQPACHQAMASRARAGAEPAAQRRAGQAPCLTGTCGADDGKLRPPPATVRFILPPAWHLSLVEFDAEVAAAADLVVMASREPETPPPRLA